MEFWKGFSMRKSLGHLLSPHRKSQRQADLQQQQHSNSNYSNSNTNSYSNDSTSNMPTHGGGGGGGFFQQQQPQQQQQAHSHAHPQNYNHSGNAPLHAANANASSTVNFSAEAVASLPPPGLSGPTQLVFSPSNPSSFAAAGGAYAFMESSTSSTSPPLSSSSHSIPSGSSSGGGGGGDGGRYLAFVSSSTAVIRANRAPPAIYRPLTVGGSAAGTATPTMANSTASYPTTPQQQHQHQQHLHPLAPTPLVMGLPLQSPTSTPTSSAAASTTTAAAATSTANNERILLCLDLSDFLPPQHQLTTPSSSAAAAAAPPNSTKWGPGMGTGGGPFSRSHKTIQQQPQHSINNNSASSSSSSPSSTILQPQPLLTLTRSTSKRRILDGNSSGSEHSFAGSGSEAAMSLEERLRRERQRLTASSGSLTQFSWAWTTVENSPSQPQTATNNTMSQTQQTTPTAEPLRKLRLLIPARGSLYIQDGILSQNSHAKAANSMQQQQQQPQSSTSGTTASTSGSTHGRPSSHVRCIHDKARSAPAVDPQLSPDGTMVAWSAEGELYVKSATSTSRQPAIRLTFGAIQSDTQCISHGVADFVAQEEMDRYRGFWWHPDNSGILLARVDESKVPLFRIMHQDSTDGVTADSGSTPYEDHRYPFAGKENPLVKLAFVRIDRSSILADNTKRIRSTTTPAATTNLTADDVRQDVDDDQTMEDDDDDYGIMNGAVPTGPFSKITTAAPVDAAASSPLHSKAQEMAIENWSTCLWFDSPREASEYLARVYWLPDGCAAVQWQNRAQTVTVMMRMDLKRGKSRTLLMERSDVWINLHHMFKVLPRAIHPDECVHVERNIPPIPNPLPAGSFSFIMASERTGFWHLYLYTYVPGINGEQACLLRTISAGEWMVESIVGVDMSKDAVFVTGTYDSVLERHLYALPITNCRVSEDGNNNNSNSSNNYNSASGDDFSPNGVRRGLSKVMHALSGKSSSSSSSSSSNRRLPLGSAMKPVRLTIENGMHSIVMDDQCRMFADTSSDIDRPTTVKIFEIPLELFSTNNATNGSSSSSSNLRVTPRLLFTLFDAMKEDKSIIELTGNRTGNGKDSGSQLLACLPAPELISFPTSDGTETLHAAVYKPDVRIHGPGPYPLICAVYGGPHVQRVNRSWSQCADMRAQRLRSMGFCVVKCDNRGSSRRGLAFESAIARRLGRLEVLDQVAAVRQLTLRGIADPIRVGVYGWSYGGYLSAMCLCRAPDVFHAAVAGAPVTSWDGYDTHYTERYMGFPADNPAGYRESAVLDHVPNMRGKLMIVHGLIDENVHFRHTARLINKLIAANKNYELLIFPDERHSPRRLRDRIYMEQRIGDFFWNHLMMNYNNGNVVGGGDGSNVLQQPTALDLAVLWSQQQQQQQQQQSGSGGGSNSSSSTLQKALRNLSGHL